MTTEISTINSKNQKSDNTQNVSTIDFVSSTSHSSVHDSTPNYSNNRKDLIRKLIGNSRNRGTGGKYLPSNQGILSYLRSFLKTQHFR